MLKILHLDTGRDLRGGQWQLLMLARGLNARSHEQLIVCPRESALHSLAHDERFETLGLTLHGVGSARALLRLRRLILARHFHIVHAHDARSQTVSWLASSMTPALRVASRRVVFVPRGGLIHRLKYTHTCHGVIAVSAFVREQLVRSGIPSTIIAVIPDGIEFPARLASPAERLQARQSFHLDEGDFVIGHLGAFTPEKGQETALQAFHVVAQHVTGARFLIAGDGPLRSVLMERYRDPRGLTHFVGRLDDLRPFMSCLDLFLMPSLSEGLGSSALIAMAHGVPVIASRTGGLPEIVTEGETGWLAEAGSAAELAGKIDFAAADRLRLAAMGERAREKAKGFTNDIMARRTEDFYARVAARAKTPAPAL
ncbi:MAG: glycosyltransferase family 4 protein [Terriglobia bacterium]